MHLVIKRLLPLTFLGLAVITSGCGDDEEDTPEQPPAETGFEFRDDEPNTYTQVDRVGAPLVSYALITDRAAYDRGTLAEEQTIAELTANLAALHTALDEELIAANLSPCAPAQCVAQASPIILPDRLSLDPEADQGFPNGRRPSDPAADVLLAALLLDVTTPGACEGEPCTLLTLAEIPLNPEENDVDFLDDFPYLAPPHEAK